MVKLTKTIVNSARKIYLKMKWNAGLRGKKYIENTDSPNSPKGREEKKTWMTILKN